MKSRFKWSSLIILITTAALNYFIWLVFNKPLSPVETGFPISSFSYNPYLKNQSPFDTLDIHESQIENDIRVISGKTRIIRTYSSLGGLQKIPAIAAKYGMTVIASAWLDARTENNLNETEVESVIRLARSHRNISRIIIGNETQLHGTCSQEELIRHLREARSRLSIPVSTAEPWDFWLRHPEMVNEVDFISIHILPYWAEVPIDQAVDYVVGKYLAVKNAYPNKMVMIAETGWPSDGPQKGAAVASQQNQADFIRAFVQRAGHMGLNYNIIEAFDQPWKQSTEGRAGEHWGIMNADRAEKFPFSGPVYEDPNWKYWALSSSIMGFLSISFFFFRRPNLRKRAKIFSTLVIQTAIATGTQLAREVSDQYMSPEDIIFWTIMITAQILLAIIMITDMAEIADVVGGKPLKRKFLPFTDYDRTKLPFVSLHLACCREPPEMVITTIESLAALDYPHFEVLVIDNNTTDEKLWKPVEKRCQELGSRFRFFHLEKWPGFKAGALNFALKNTDPRAEVVGVVDADYVVNSNWLIATIPYFVEDKKMAIVQAPQEHRDWQETIFQKMENDEYAGFFRIGMVQRNEDNAIIQHGTMTLIRRTTLDELNGWAEWCICEDAELGLRILNEGLHSIYLDHPFGHGLVPDNYEAYAKQRFRWAYGAMRILRGHWKSLFGFTGKLSQSQRYQFVKGWLPWIGDGLHMAFTILAIAWSIKLIVWPRTTDFPEPIFIYPALGLVLIRILGTLWTYAVRVPISRERTLMAMIAGGSLTHKIAKAVFQGLLFFKQPFYRTPKMDLSRPLFKSLRSVWEETFLALSLIISAVVIISIFGFVNNQAVLWSSALLIQAFPYYAAITASLVSSFSAFKRYKKMQMESPSPT